MRNVILSEDLYPYAKGAEIRVDDTSASRVVEAGVGKYVEDVVETVEPATDPVVDVVKVDEPKAPKITNGRTATFD